MIRFKNIAFADGRRADLTIASHTTIDIDGSEFLALPSFIDPHVHFRFPGDEHKEQWTNAAAAAFASGITYVFDMPNNNPSITTVEQLKQKRTSIEAMLQRAALPLRFELYLGASREDLAEISKAKGYAIGVKIFMGGSTGELLLDDYKDQREAFQRAADADLVVAVHAESEKILRQQRELLKEREDIYAHSELRDRKAAVIAVEQAIEHAAATNAKLYILHISTVEELDLIRQAKRSGVRLMAEATPHHLYLTQSDYEKFGTKLKVNPPVRTLEDMEALWRAIEEGTIDTIGSDHAPHTWEEKQKPPLQAPAGIAGIEFVLPLLLQAHNKGKVSLQRLVELMRTRVATFFAVEAPSDWVIVDLKAQAVVRDELMYSKCRFSPYHGLNLQGWPLYTIVAGQLIDLRKKVPTQ